MKWDFFIIMKHFKHTKAATIQLCQILTLVIHASTLSEQITSQMQLNCTAFFQQTHLHSSLSRNNSHPEFKNLVFIISSLYDILAIDEYIRDQFVILFVDFILHIFSCNFLLTQYFTFMILPCQYLEFKFFFFIQLLNLWFVSIFHYLKSFCHKHSCPSLLADMCEFLQDINYQVTGTHSLLLTRSCQIILSPQFLQL